MCPDVDGLCVNVEDGAEAGVERGHGRPVRLVDVVIVLCPGRQRVERHQPRAGRPHLYTASRRASRRTGDGRGCYLLATGRGWHRHIWCCKNLASTNSQLSMMLARLIHRQMRINRTKTTAMQKHTNKQRSKKKRKRNEKKRIPETVQWGR